MCCFHIVPPKVTVCTALPVYDNKSNTLKRIEVQWEPIPVCVTQFSLSNFTSLFSSQDFDEYITDGITASVQNYIIHVAPEINVTIEANDSAVCSSTSCKYDYYQVKTETLDYYEVSITTKNLLTDGYSETQVCSSTMISKNHIIMVMIV